VEEYYGGPLTDPRPIAISGHDDHIGWHEQGDGNWFYGLNVENGRIADRDGWTLKKALREICRQYAPGIRLTGHQSILFTDIKPDDRAGLETVLRDNGIGLDDELSAVRRWSMACVALPTCGLAVTESERIMPGLMDQLETELKQLDLSQDLFTVRMTGCPNGCARPYNADVGLVGKTKDKYTIYLGGHRFGTRLGFIFKDLVPLDEIAAALRPVFEYFKQARQDGETLGDFCHRKGADDLNAWCEAHTGATKNPVGKESRL
jgi:sulfite reductase (ferredoxin)